MFKKIFAATALAVSLGMSGTANAIDLNDAFNNLTGASSMTSTQAAAVYKSAARTSMDLGGVQMRVPRSQAQFVSITPPSVSASCAGISAHFGGISFISGQQIQTMIQHIEQGVPGAVLQLAIKLLCPQCEAILQAMEKLAQDAAKMAIDSCRVSNQLVGLAESAGNMINPSVGNTATNFCAQQQAGSGTQSDSLMAELSSACYNSSVALNTVADWMQGNGGGDTNALGGGTPAQREAWAAKVGLYGNRTWNILSAMGWCPPTQSGGPSCTQGDPSTEGPLHTKLLLMNLLGTTVVTAPSADSASSASGASGATAASSTSSGSSTAGVTPGATSAKDNQEIFPPNVTVDDVYDMLMCGAPIKSDATQKDGIAGTAYNTRSMTNVCGNFWSTKYKSMQLYDCTDDYVMCKKVGIVTAQNLSSPVFTGPGFIFQVTKLLTDAATNVAANKPWDWNAAESKQLAALVSTAPFPLYQAINAAAVYPAAAADLLDSMGLETAELMVYATIGDMLSPIARPAGQAQLASEEGVARVYKALGAIRTDVTNHEKILGGQVALQEALSREIVQINQTIQRQVLSDDFLGNHRFATALVVNSQPKN